MTQWNRSSSDSDSVTREFGGMTIIMEKSRLGREEGLREIVKKGVYDFVCSRKSLKNVRSHFVIEIDINVEKNRNFKEEFGQCVCVCFRCVK